MADNLWNEIRVNSKLFPYQGRLVDLTKTSRASGKSARQTTYQSCGSTECLLFLLIDMVIDHTQMQFW